MSSWAGIWWTGVTCLVRLLCALPFSVLFSGWTSRRQRAAGGESQCGWFEAKARRFLACGAGSPCTGAIAFSVLGRCQQANVSFALCEADAVQVFTIRNGIFPRRIQDLADSADRQRVAAGKLARERLPQLLVNVPVQVVARRDFHQVSVGSGQRNQVRDGFAVVRGLLLELRHAGRLDACRPVLAQQSVE